MICKRFYQNVYLYMLLYVAFETYYVENVSFRLCMRREIKCHAFMESLILFTWVEKNFCYMLWSMKYTGLGALRKYSKFFWCCIVGLKYTIYNLNCATCSYLKSCRHCMKYVEYTLKQFSSSNEHIKKLSTRCLAPMFVTRGHFINTD